MNWRLGELITEPNPDWSKLILVSGYNTSASYTKTSCLALLNTLTVPERKIDVLVIGDTHIGSTIVDLATRFEDSIRVHIAYKKIPYLGYPLTQKWLIPCHTNDDILEFVLGKSIAQWLCCVNSFTESRTVKTRFIQWSTNRPNDGKIFIFPLQL